MNEILDEAYERLHRFGPERSEGELTNHGPMTVETLAHNGHADAIGHWLDVYEPLLDELPRGLNPITADNWREALGDARRTSDWPQWFRRELAEADWTDVLATWWPRLLPGIVAGATHGVIRTGHAVRALRDSGRSPARLEELAQALSYWAARWQTIPHLTVPDGDLSPARALDATELIADRSGRLQGRLSRLAESAGWPRALSSLAPAPTPELARERLTEIVTAAADRYLTHAQDSPVLLVHTATAPNAVLRTLPSLPREQWVDSLAAAWAASVAVTATYSAARPNAAAPARQTDPEDVFAAAAEHGDAHVIKFADTALDVYGWTGDGTALAAAARARDLIEPGV